MKIPKNLQEVFDDNLSGSEELKQNLVKFFLEEIAAGKEIKNYFQPILQRFSEFAAVTDFISRLKNIDDNSLKDFLTNEISQAENIYFALFKHIQPIMFDGAKIVTISNSKTFIKVLEIAYEKFNGIKIYVSESRPMNEGVIMAEQLSEIGFDVTLITEAMIPKFVAQSDFALCGADKILPDGGIVNKIGTKIIALACKHYGKPFYVIAAKNKKVHKRQFDFSLHPTEEILKSQKRKFKIAENIYFEIIEKDLITKIITD